MSSMSRSEYIAKWGQTHGGYEANASFLARTWLGFAYTFTRPLIAM
ncbi:MAG: CDP-alcohol phosphatidyltransferase family protein, partial [Actinobacteria bacterium]|nr:CDP-alcohol phosphatidyltransferase family protein [Actinomycetota bacterium]